jgi:hypothetical protein
LTNNNFFHVDVHEKSHYEMNRVVKKIENSIHKCEVTLNKKTRRRNGH